MQPSQRYANRMAQVYSPPLSNSRLKWLRHRLHIIGRMPAVADLHCHSRYSDGTLAVDDLVELAQGRGVQLFALTDHDELRGIAGARAAAQRLGVQFVSGVEISSEWHGISVHIVGLRFDDGNNALQQALAAIRSERAARAQRMDTAFAAIGISGTLAGAAAYAPNPELISRTHFARHLVDRGVCGSMGEVFGRFMKPGKPGYVAHHWLPMERAIALIKAAGGRAVLAHPGRYALDGHGGASALLKAFTDAGGDAVEVVCAAHQPSEWAEFAGLARKFGLLASVGSDFHSPIESRVRFGDLPRLSPSLKPVWQDWPEAEVLYA